MNSIEEKLRTIAEIQLRLIEMQNKMKKDQESIQGELKRLKKTWNDSQMDRFTSSAYVGKFTNSLASLISRIDKTIGFLENKYSTLETHRN